jgi:hypothetical protein
MAVGVVISFGGAKSRAFRDDRPRTRSEDRPGHQLRRRKPGHRFCGAAACIAPNRAAEIEGRRKFATPQSIENSRNRKIYRE